MFELSVDPALFGGFDAAARAVAESLAGRDLALGRSFEALLEPFRQQQAQWGRLIISSSMSRALEELSRQIAVRYADQFAEVGRRLANALEPAMQVIALQSIPSAESFGQLVVRHSAEVATAVDAASVEVQPERSRALSVFRDPIAVVFGLAYLMNLSAVLADPKATPAQALMMLSAAAAILAELLKQLNEPTR